MNELTHFISKRPQQKGNKIGLEECYHFYKSLSILYECDSQKMKIDEGVCKALTIRYYIVDIISYIDKTTPILPGRSREIELRLDGDRLMPMMIRPATVLLQEMSTEPGIVMRRYGSRKQCSEVRTDPM